MSKNREIKSEMFANGFVTTFYLTLVKIRLKKGTLAMVLICEIFWLNMVMYNVMHINERDINAYHKYSRISASKYMKRRIFLDLCMS